MVEVLPDNGATSTLSASVVAVDTVLTIQSGDATNWPVSGEYRAVLWQSPDAGPWELVKVTGGQGTASLTVQRAAEAYHGTQTARNWPSGTGIAAVLTHAGVTALLDSQRLTMYPQEFVPASSATTVTLSHTPEAVLIVSREGVVQSVQAGHYSVAGAVLTFGASFNGSERVIVSYSVRG